ncbi:MAG: hypothetical protein IJ215_05860 [Clostridia bacterium]|nr:hypothetical protein [Clostridia bacterium]
MDKKKMMKYILIVLLVILVLIILEVMLRGLASVSEDIKTRSQIRKEEKEYQQTEEYQTESYLETSIQSTIEMIKAGDYESIYSFLEPTYKDFMEFDTVEKFKDYMNDYIGTPISATLLSHQIYQDKYICNVSITTESKTEAYTVLVKPLEGDNFYIIFDNILSIQNVLDQYFAFNQYVECNLRYRLVGPSGISYVVDIKNTSGATLDGSFANTTLTKSDFFEYQPVNDVSSITIAPGETARVRFDINETASRRYEELYLDIDYEGKNGDQFDITLYIEESY